MKIIDVIGAQGEVRIFKIDSIPQGATPLTGKDAKIIGHSETGHHHVLVAERPKVYEADDAPEGMRVLYAILDAPAELEHQRGFDTHDPFKLDAGTYMFRMDREFDHYQELARKVAD